MSNYQTNNIGKAVEYRKLLNSPYVTVGDLLELLKSEPPQSRVNIKVITLFEGEEAIYFTPLKATQDNELNADDNICIGQIRH